MAIILTYDLSGSQTLVKNSMIDKGYTISFINTATGSRINLPETTLHHPTKTTGDAINDIKASANFHNVTVKRAIATYLRSDWTAIAGVPL